MNLNDLSDDERGRDEPYSKPRRVARVPIEELAEQVDGRPDRLAIDRLGGRADGDPEEADDGEAQGDGDELWPERCARLTRA